MIHTFIIIIIYFQKKPVGFIVMITPNGLVTSILLANCSLIIIFVFKISVFKFSTFFHGELEPAERSQEIKETDRPRAAQSVTYWGLTDRSMVKGSTKASGPCDMDQRKGAYVVVRQK
jgi:hypothetical protein